MALSSRLILAFSSASRSASQKAYRDKEEAKKNEIINVLELGILTARGRTIIVDFTSKSVASFSAATTTPSIMGNARRFLNSNPV
jgi:hypothetical protein